MGKIEVTINGKAYPCRQTMGAMLRFKHETGKELTDSDGCVSDMLAYLWCCVASACKADGVDFDMSLLDFADAITPEDTAAWSQHVESENKSQGGAGEKKSEASSSS